MQTEEWKSSMQLLKSRLNDLNAKSALLRFTAAKISQNLPTALEEIGFKKHHDRIEYKTLLSELPDEAGTPLTWKAVGTEGLDLEFAAKIMSRCSEGDPNLEPGFNSLESVKVDLADEELYHQQDAIHIGYLNNEPVAFVFAQTSPETGWARLTYVGVVPEARGQGLGIWMHRHGLAMMRAQGGIEYHGGTVAANKAMIKTFEKNGCKELRRMQDWTLSSNEL
ncbi:Acetyltransferase (GNAT) family protein [compost metagenome]